MSINTTRRVTVMAILTTGLCLITGMLAHPAYATPHPEPANAPPEVSAPFGPEQAQAALINYGLPIISPSLHIGHDSPRPIDAHYLPCPVFLIGCESDDCSASIHWLAKHGRALRRIGAVGWIVSAKDRAAVAQLTMAANGPPLVSASGECFAHQYGIHTYPVLITRDHIE